MDFNDYMSLDFSILYRCMHKYYDIALTNYDISSGQVSFLTILNKNEGITLAELANICSFDKGTVTKGIQKLEEKGYVIEQNSTDKRAKLLYLTSKAKSIMSDLYMIKRNWWEFITKEVDDESLLKYQNVQNLLVKQAKSYLEATNTDDIKFFGLQKTTLLDYPGKLASTIFTGGCNFCCPFCQNSDLVYLREGLKEISENEILTFLNSRKKILDGICISGGEPLLHKGLIPFIKKVKEMGLLVKLDTNGFLYERLKELVDLKLVDYIAMDIKNSPSKYSVTSGVDNLDLEPIKKSVKLLKSSPVDYEFRTTIVKEFHDESSIKEIGLWLRGAKRYFLQNFRNDEFVINKNLHSLDINTINKFKEILKNDILEVELRGV